MINTLGPPPAAVGDTIPSSPTGTGMVAKPNPAAPSNSTLPGPFQQQNIPGLTGGINNMVRALLGAQYQNRLNNAAGAAQQNTVGAPGAPLNINSPLQQSQNIMAPYTPSTWDPSSSSGGLY